MKASSIRYRIDNTLSQMHLLPEQRWDDIDITIIVSTGRTGTRFFGRFFDTFPGVHARHEPKPDMVQLGVDYARGQVSFQHAVRVIERNRRALARETRRHGARVYVESNNRFFSLLRPLRHVFPHARIVHVLRDGRDYVRSGLGREWYTEKDRFPRLRANMFPDDPYRDRWERMNRFEKIAWRWQKKDSMIARDVQELDNTLTVRFEEIFADSERPGLFAMTRFMGFSDAVIQEQLAQMGTEKMNTTRESPIPRWPNWSEEMTKRFDEIAGHHLRYCNYSKE